VPPNAFLVFFVPWWFIFCHIGAKNARVRVSDRLKRDFDNGQHYYQLNGSEIWLPRRADDRPNEEFLEWHARERFRG
jgi:hypothetical protein